MIKETLIKALLQLAAAFAAMLSFAMLFNVPKKHYAHCAIAGASGWLGYWVMMLLQSSTVFASLVAVLPLTALARIFAIRRKAPITIFLICGIFPLVPGAAIYYTAYNFIMGLNSEAFARGAEAIKIAVAIAVGITLVLSLPGRLFGALRANANK